MSEKQYLKKLKKEYEFSKTLTDKEFDKRYMRMEEDWSDTILPKHRYYLDKLYIEGGQLIADKECDMCDSENEYVCFECELIQIEKIKEEEDKDLSSKESKS
tara:strand:- start:416 stop:721 length:306 start_codon:yes stop_codon:yes gene_type:complete